MKQYIKHLAKLEESLETLSVESEEIYQYSETCIRTCKQTLSEMRQRVLKQGFRDESEECAFFKTIKSKIVSYLIYYMNRIEIARLKPCGSIKLERRFFLGQISILQSYFHENRELYEYYLRGLSDRDTEFFLRKNDTIKLHHDSIPSMVDAHFSTSHDMVLAKILGNVKTIEYLQKIMIQSTNKNIDNINNENNPIFKWTGTKVELVELVYALHATGQVNNGKASIIDLAKGFENLFQIDLGDYYRKFLEIRNRKSPQTKFLNYLKRSLESRIVEADG